MIRRTLRLSIFATLAAKRFMPTFTTARQNNGGLQWDGISTTHLWRRHHDQHPLRPHQIRHTKDMEAYASVFGGEEMKGKHSENCIAEKPTCRCITCSKDDGACCVMHYGLVCGDDHCPDYEPETDDDNDT
jgi:hypothetical protein